MPRSLVEKLGLTAGTVAAVLRAPPGYAALLGVLPPGARLVTRLPPSPRFIHQFARRRADLEAALPRAARALADDGMLWISWPKRASGLGSDITEDVVREIALPLGLVDVKVCAVDATWSGLKLVRRRERRRAAAT